VNPLWVVEKDAMPKKPVASATFKGLRRVAEETLRRTRRDVAAMPLKNVQQLVYELQVHQIELEVQNEELRQAQGEIEAARDRYVELYDCAPIGYLTLSATGVILEANLPACTLLGPQRKQLLGQSVLRFVKAEDQPTLLSRLRESLKTGIRQACELGLDQEKNLTVRFETVVLPDKSGHPHRLLTALLDMTERTRAEAALLVCQQGVERQRSLEERERIGHDLHDGVLQSLYAIGLSLETCKQSLANAPQKAAAILAQSIGELRSEMREVRTFIEGLEVAGVPETAPLSRDLSGSLRAMAGTLARLYGRQIRVAINQTVAAGLSDAQSLEIFNLVKEALSNSFRHARATLVQVSLRQVKDGTRLAVRDNGTGLRRQGATTHGQGFASMAARARRLGGTLSVQSKPAHGTKIVLDLPKSHRMDRTEFSSLLQAQPALRKTM